MEMKYTLMISRPKKPYHSWYMVYESNKLQYVKNYIRKHCKGWDWKIVEIIEERMDEMLCKEGCA